MSDRIGGFFLLLACIAVPIIIVDYIITMSGFDGGVDATNAERAAYAKQVYSRVAIGWTFEILAVAFIATASIIFMKRSSRAGWALAAIGAVTTLPMYPFMLGGYGEVLSTADPDVELFAIIRAMSNVSFLVGQGLMMLGFALVLWIERHSADRLFPRWAHLVGIAANTAAGVVLFLIYFDQMSSFVVGGMFALIGFAVMALFGASAALPGVNKRPSVAEAA